jgi:tRNA modification GTPase
VSGVQRPLWWWSTARAPGAIAVAHVHGMPAGVDRFLHAFCAEPSPRAGALGWRRFGTVDDGVVARVGERHALVMPHGGPRIRQLLDARAAELGARAPYEGEREELAYPEAADGIERAMLAAIARAASPMAIDLLAAQPDRWRRAAGGAAGAGAAGADAGATAGTDALARMRAEEPDARDLRLRRLVDPPRVCVTGPANAGKSTLLNALAGREVAIAHAAPGTTRDAVAARLDLAGLVVDWFDTPGVRDGMDAVERAAAAIAERALAHADLVVELTAPGLGWHVLGGARGGSSGAVRLRVLNQRDRAEAAACAELASAELAVSARTGDGLEALVARVRDLLVPPGDLDDPRPWRFA